jgi:predicted lipase
MAVYAIRAGRDAILAFRGTQSRGSILQDLKVIRRRTPEGRLHAGFADGYADIHSHVVSRLRRFSAKRVWLTGHSLGGALALLAAWLLKRKFVPVHEVCTFGAPMIGNKTACEAFNREFSGRIFRYINGRDPVPKLPTLSLAANEFVHVDSQRLLGSHPHTGLAEVMGTVASKAVNGLLAGTLVDEAWKHITEEVGAHFLDVYRDLLKG